MPVIYALHGFLGLPSDWNQFQHLEPIDLWGSGLTFGHLKPQSSLLGYSLGGRLALHALIANPSQWKSAIIVSAHPGLPPHEREARLKSDEVWAKRFESEPWDDVIKAWNQQPIFQYDIPRNENDFDRKKLAQALRVWSLGHQQDLRPDIAELPMPITWIVGENDARFSQMIFKNEKSRVIVVPNSGHRVPWQQPKIFQEIINEHMRQHMDLN